MSKKTFSPGTMLSPLPAVMVSCGDMKNKNIITIAWTGIINSDPPMTYISVRESRHSYKMIKERGSFVINLTTEALAFATDYCGVKSGKDVDKFKEMKLTAEESEETKTPMIKESPVNIECKVRETENLGSHTMFIADIVKVYVDDNLIDENDKIHVDKPGLVAYLHGEYFGLKKYPIGKFGYSVMKPKTRRRINRETNNRYKNRG